MDYPCGKFGDCSFSRFGSIMRTHRHTQRQKDADKCLTPATLVGVNNEQSALRWTSQLRKATEEDGDKRSGERNVDSKFSNTAGVR